MFSRSRVDEAVLDRRDGGVLQALRDGAVPAHRQARPRRVRRDARDGRGAQLRASGRRRSRRPLRPRPRRRADAQGDRQRRDRGRHDRRRGQARQGRGLHGHRGRGQGRQRRSPLEVADVALAQFGQQTGELVFISRAPEKRQELWRELRRRAARCRPRGRRGDAPHRRRHRPELRRRCSTARSSARWRAAGAAR